MLAPVLSLPELGEGSLRLPPLTNAESMRLSLPALLSAFATRFDTGGGLSCCVFVGGAVVAFPPPPLGTHSL